MMDSTDPRFDNPRAVQIRLPNFTLPLLCEVGRKVRDIFAEGAASAERLVRVVDDAYIEDLARAVAGKLGGKVGVAPRIFLKKLVSDILDRVDQFPDFDPRQHYSLTLGATEMTLAEQASADALDLDGIELSL